ncbi:MAG: type II toxin-antitoxin system HicA family toxin [Gemmatimonadota bacterium]
MKLPRDLSGDDLAKKLIPLGYTITRQTGSHLRLSRTTSEGSHHVTIPRHRALRVGTLNAILRDVANTLGISKEELLRRITIPTHRQT